SVLRFSLPLDDCRRLPLRTFAKQNKRTNISFILPFLILSCQRYNASHSALNGEKTHSTYLGA
ncbi:hypothetical protein, partial [Bacillus safensis]|uniref:hypothetical protein n=1 Tax=Bacillus safensis TaxID=561879 RepID=UPI00398284B3